MFLTIFGQHLDNIWKILRQYLDDIWAIFRQYFGYIKTIFGRYLDKIGAIVFIWIWTLLLFRKSLDNLWLFLGQYLSKICAIFSWYVNYILDNIVKISEQYLDNIFLHQPVASYLACTGLSHNKIARCPPMDAAAVLIVVTIERYNWEQRHHYGGGSWHGESQISATQQCIFKHWTKSVVGKLPILFLEE